MKIILCQTILPDTLNGKEFDYERVIEVPTVCIGMSFMNVTADPDADAFRVRHIVWDKLKQRLEVHLEDETCSEDQRHKYYADWTLVHAR